VRRCTRVSVGESKTFLACVRTYASTRLRGKESESENESEREREREREGGEIEGEKDRA